VTRAVQDTVTSEIDYRVDGGGWVRYTAPFGLGSDGAHTVEYRASVGGSPVESSSGSLSLSIDRVAPSVSADLSTSDLAPTTNSPVTLTLAATDATSGVDRIEYRTTTGGWTAYSEPLDFSEVGSYNVLYRAFDAAGQASVVQVASIVITDGETPPGVLDTESHSVTPGESFTVRGKGFAGGERLELWLYAGAVFLGATQADADGNFAIEVTLPRTTGDGAYTIRAFGESSGVTADLSLTVRASVPPTGGVDTGNVTDVTGSAGEVGELSETGVSGLLMVLPAGLALVLAGLVLMAVRRRSRRV
jgi:hypothetical protein